MRPARDTLMLLGGGTLCLLVVGVFFLLQMRWTLPTSPEPVEPVEIGNVAQQATSLLEQCVSCKSADAYYSYAHKLMNPARRIQALQEVITRFPEHRLAREKLAWSLWDAGYLEESLEQYEQIVKQNPRNHYAQHRVVSLYCKTEQPEKAHQHRDHYQSLLQQFSNPTDGERSALIQMDRILQYCVP